MAKHSLLPFPPHFLQDFVTTILENTLAIAKLTFLYTNPDVKLLISSGQFGNPYLYPPHSCMNALLATYFSMTRNSKFVNLSLLFQLEIIKIVVFSKVSKNLHTSCRARFDQEFNLRDTFSEHMARTLTFSIYSKASQTLIKHSLSAHCIVSQITRIMAKF